MFNRTTSWGGSHITTLRMNLYVFLTHTIGGTFGGPLYVRNKLNWLKSKGYKVIVFDSTGRKNLKIQYEEFKIYKNNRIKELFYSPFVFSNKRRHSIIKRVVNTIVSSENATNIIIVESNTFILAEWGELISKRLKAKHIVYLIGENLIINDLKTYSFLYFKYSRSELFSISSKAFELLWSNFFRVNNPDNYYWTANCLNDVKDLPCQAIDSIDKRGFLICHFGRFKNYFPDMFKEVNKFAIQNLETDIIFLLVGVESLTSQLKIQITSKNVKTVCVPSISPIPQSIFKKSDVIIAVSGCSLIAYNEDAKVITYDVNTLKPLGVLGYTTSDINYSTDMTNDEHLNLSDILNDVLVLCKYNNIKPFLKGKERKLYDYQLSKAAIPSDQNFYPFHLYNRRGRISSFILKVFIKMGLINVLSRLRYKR